MWGGNSKCKYAIREILVNVPVRALKLYKHAVVASIIVSVASRRQQVESLTEYSQSFDLIA